MSSDVNGVLIVDSPCKALFGWKIFHFIVNFKQILQRGKDHYACDSWLLGTEISTGGSSPFFVAKGWFIASWIVIRSSGRITYEHEKMRKWKKSSLRNAMRRKKKDWKKKRKG